MTNTDKLLALITIQQAVMTPAQKNAANEAWLKLINDAEPTDRLLASIGAKPVKMKAPAFLGWGDDDGDDR